MRDENRNQPAVDRRVEGMFVYIEKRRQAWEETLDRMRATGARGHSASGRRPDGGGADAVRYRRSAVGREVAPVRAPPRLGRSGEQLGRRVAF